MTRPRPAPIVVVAAALALGACGTHTPTANSTRNRPGAQELGGISGAPATDGGSAATGAPSTGGDAGGGGGTGSGTGGGNQGAAGNSTPTPATGGGTGPHIVSFSATGAVCPVEAKPGAPYSRPGQVTVSWKLTGADHVDLLMDKGLWRSYTGTQGSDTLPFACPDPTGPNTHTYTLTVRGTSVSKTVSATARPDP
jgi:hypothetical protein